MRGGNCRIEVIYEHALGCFTLFLGCFWAVLYCFCAVFDSVFMIYLGILQACIGHWWQFQRSAMATTRRRFIYWKWWILRFKMLNLYSKWWICADKRREDLVYGSDACWQPDFCCNYRFVLFTNDEFCSVIRANFVIFDTKFIILNTKCCVRFVVRANDDDKGRDSAVQYKDGWSQELLSGDFTLKMMDFILNMMDFTLKMMDFPLEMMDFTLKNEESARSAREDVVTLLLLSCHHVWHCVLRSASIRRSWISLHFSAFFCPVCRTTPCRSDWDGRLRRVFMRCFMLFLCYLILFLCYFCALFMLKLMDLIGALY